MADLIIKPSAGAGNKLIIQDQAGGAILTTADSGAVLHEMTGTLSEITPGTSGNLLTSDGTNWTSATAPSHQPLDSDLTTIAGLTPGTSGNLLTSDGTNWTSTAPAPAGGGANYTNDGWKYITSNWKDYSAFSAGNSGFNYAWPADFDMQFHLGSNVSESGGYYTLATAGVYAVSVMVLDYGNPAGTHVWLFQEDISASTNIGHEPLIASENSPGGYAAQGSFTWFVDVGAGDILHIRCRGIMDGNWCGGGSPSCAFHGCRIG